MAIRWLMTVAWVLLAMLGATPARAQGVGQWVSPGPLATAHADLEGLTQCVKCHAPMLGVTTDRCTACHEDVGTEIRTKDGFHANKADKCGTCHPDHKGRDFQLARLELSPADHLRETGFALDGAHRPLACLECHTKGDWGAVEPECTACHDSPHGDTDHVDLGECTDCHSTTAWTVKQVPIAVFDHQNRKQTDYVLEGAHEDVGCTECHLDAEFVPTKFETCTSCHDNPHHTRFTQACDGCHTVEDWGVAKFDHTLTGYTLEGLHGGLVCEKCHKSDITRRLPHEACTDCHKDVHKGQFQPRGCETCHTVFEPAFAIPTFDHDATAFPLAGKHTIVKCDDCHGAMPNAKYTPLDHADCDACHDDVHDGKFEPTDCKVCHVETGWEVGEFDHDRTDFPLKGEHVGVECVNCHPNEQWSGIAHDTCDQCHDDHPHGTIFPSAECAECHVETAWATVSFDHVAKTEFDLAPQHTGQACKECHETMDAFAGLDTACEGCHADDDPPGHFEGACDECHVAARWLPATLGDRSHDVTGYPLVGTHTLLACEDCHGSTEWMPFSAGGTDCVDCHADDDAHRNLLGDLCDDCHTPVNWMRTSFRHTITGYPLRGAHRLAACDDCHAVSYAGTPDECWRCHEAEAPRDIAPHQSVFFPVCDTCHRPYTWASLPNSRTDTSPSTTSSFPTTGRRIR
ncbi:MAG: cytochrome c3 family protein [Myxococcota bacterium]